jgi:hypothetical protein
MPKYPMHSKVTEIMNIVSLFWVPKTSPIAAIHNQPKDQRHSNFIGFILDIVVPLKPTL